MSVSPEPPTSLRERQRHETELCIRRAALRLATEHGLGALTVADVSRAAGVSRRTFFNYFRSMEEALVPTLPAFRAADERAFLDAGQPDLLDALATLLGRHLGTGAGTSGGAEDGPAVMRLVEANPELGPRLLEVFEQFDRRVADLVARRVGREPDDLFCTVAATAATATVRAALRAAHRDRPGPLDQHAVREAFAVLRSVGAAARI